jgi:hypothetical protein
MLLSNEKVSFLQMSLGMLESMGIDDAIQESNSDEIEITKVPSLPSRLQIEEEYSVMCEEIAQPSQCVPWIWESKSLSEVLTMLASTNESQFQETFISSQSLFETSNLESNTYVDDDCKSGSHDNHLSSFRRFKYF